MEGVWHKFQIRDTSGYKFRQLSLEDDDVWQSAQPDGPW
jgi:hypothetical protein